MADKFYANDANVGFEEYDTLEEAKSAAEEMLQIAMDACDPEWPDWATSISYGRLIEIARATETNIRAADPEEDDPDVPEYFCDVELIAEPDELALLKEAATKVAAQIGNELCMSERSFRDLRESADVLEALL
jgi:hypothetical protein